ncbi:hypothetical protein [Paenibacillus sp. HB172176]|uniref:hypothetical protein n=1 Tax=Paenibacillus sp. HB172176 TaxID=2493690 RepID=UPI001439CBB6|nr:hypothetical protein [Paenibacillus sp. HB172176]
MKNGYLVMNTVVTLTDGSKYQGQLEGVDDKQEGDFIKIYNSVGESFVPSREISKIRFEIIC